jgi:hypothetical protein
MKNTIAALWASIVRTLTPLIVGSVLGWFVTTGITLDDRFEGLLTLVISGLLTGTYYVAVRLLETYVTPKFGWLLGLAKTPTQYTPESPASVRTPADPGQPAAGAPPAI